ncbi:nose resistant to fluoxetine protein 6-like isoform X2 [Gordionus sp. m RMFG-2023]
MGKILKTVSVYKIITHTQDLTLQLVPENVNRAAGYSSWLKGKHQKYVKRRSRDLIFGVAFFSIFGAILLFIYLKERRDFVTNLHSKPRSASRGNNFFRALPTLSQCFSPRQNLLKILRGGPSYINSNNVSNSPDSASSNSTHPSQPLGNGYNYESARGIVKTSQNVIKSPLTFLTGVRALSTLHVMYGHTYVFSLFFVSNFEHVMKGMKGRFYHHSFGHLNSSLITPTDAGKNILPRDHDDNDPILNLNRFDSFFVFMYCAFFAVDSFFLFSGLLSSAFTPILSQLSKHANQITLNNLIRSYPAPLIYRYIRLTPVYAAVLVFEIFVSPYIGNGPYWASEGVDPDCRSLWWTNLAYVNNYFTTGHRTASGKLDGKVRMCMPWAWYLACDFQFHLVSPLIIFALIKFSAPASSQKRGKGLKLNLKRLGIISACFIGLLVALSFCISYYNRYKVLVFIDNTNTMKFFAEFYIRPYIRIPPFFLGLLLGCYLKLRASADNKDDQCSTSHDIVDKTSDNAPNVNPLASKSRSVFRPYIIVAFLTLVAAVSAKLYGLFPNFDRYYKSSIFRPGRWDAFRSSPQFPEVMEALFLSLSRFLWPLLLILFLAFMILDWPDDPPFKCVAGTMRLVKRGLNSFLSHEAWIPVSNLSYSAYLIHPVIMLIHLRTLRYPLYFSHTNFFVHFVFYSVATFATSLFFSLAFELPFINLAKIVFQRLN